MCGITLGRYSFIGAGAVVSKNIPDFALVVGNPTKQSVENLKEEGITKKELASGNNNGCSQTHNPNVCFVGDVMLDAATYYKEHARKPQFNLPGKFILATIHRAENKDNAVRLKSIFDGFEEIGNEVPIILPLHPRTRKTIEKLDLKTSSIETYLDSSNRPFNCFD